MSVVATRLPRAERVAEVKRLRAEFGMTAPQIADRLGVPESTIRNDFTAKKCADCPAWVDPGATRCVPCGLADRTKWTPETVIDAIQRYASAHGRPPVAYDWLHADPTNDYPSFASVYGPDSAFPSWGEAIEAAGFDRPAPGHYERVEEKGLGNSSRAVLSHLREDGREWRPLPLSAALKLNEGTVDQALRLLVRRGLIERVRFGVYRATGAA